MSFRELRTFTETMRILGYPRTISVESFKVPNVELVADILYWLTKRYEPSAEIVYAIERESERVNFFRKCCETVLNKGRIKLNIKKLYQADGHAVQELLRLAAVMRQATIARSEEAGDYAVLQTQAAQRGHHEAKVIQKLCTDLTNDGSSLFALLSHEMDSRNTRAHVMSRATEIAEFERMLRDMLSNIGQQVESLQQSVVNMTADTSSIEEKIEGKRVQHERSQKRLTSLLKVRPAFMEEYERFEGDLHSEFVKYLEHYRNLEYLENELTKFNKREDDLLAEQDNKLRIMREKLRKEELTALHGANADVDEDDGDDSDDTDTDDDGDALAAAQKAQSLNQNRTDTSNQRRPRAASGRERPPVPNPTGPAATQQSGSMFTAADGDEDEDEDEDDEDSDDSDDDSDDSDDDDDDDDDDGGEEDGLGRHDRMARSAREGRPPQPSFTAGIPRARPLSATFGRTQSGGGGPTTAATAGMSKAARPESANFSQQRTPSQTQQPAPTGTSNARNRPTTAGMSVRSEPVSAAASAGQNGKLHPQAQALREQGNIFFQQKKYKESAEAYGKAIQQYEPNSDTLYCNRAAAYLMLNKCEEALADAQHAVELDPTHVKAHWRAAKACLYLGRSEMAKQLYTTAHKLAGVQTEADAIAAEMKAVDLAEKCRRCLRLREYADAQKAADQLLEIFPVNGPCSGPWVCLKSESLLYTDAHEAGTLLTTLCTEDPTNAEAWLIRGKALFYAAHDAISTTSALTYLNKARDMDVGKASIVVLNGVPGTTPSFLSTVAGRAATLINTIENFSKLRDAGNNAYAAGKWVEAYDAYTRCLNVDACNSSLKAIILCNRAAVSIQCEKWREAIEDVNASIAFNGSNAKAYTRRARIHQHNAEYMGMPTAIVHALFGN
eukprot:GILI01002446.1.p1 GENE.GILI01002446.1~~GILI01002446.1.p1  ORF type:complete len:897 (+),score=212.41 GILI01002446.1:64-2754(+)